MRADSHARTSDSVLGAEAVCVSAGAIATGQKLDIFHGIDAVVAHLSELDEPQIVQVLVMLHEGWDFRSD